MKLLSNGWTYLSAIFVIFVIILGLGSMSETKRANRAEAQVAQLQQDARVAAAIAQVRADAAKQALDVATAAASANHKQATTYLQLPTPAPADRCAAAQALVDEAIQKERQ